ncbi:MAG TPA: sulfotransferase [Gammaproteobacteria bacterium]|nr:sulfotransferase [Gammaproteobacteria bacterium]
MHEFRAVASRYLVLWTLFFLPRARRIALERRIRGKEEYRKLGKADWVLMSWGKSGRTWFRVMLSHFYHVKYGLPKHHLLEFDNLHRKNPAIPRVLFSHNNYVRDYLRDWTTLAHFRGKKVVLLVRDPRDVAVSQFFQWKYRMRPHKKLLNEYPPHGADISIFDFVMDKKAGVPRIVEFFNGWARSMPNLDDLLVIRYEDMRRDPHATMKKVLEFVGTPGTDDEIRQAVDFAAYDNMKKMEEKKFFRLSGARVKAGDQKNPDSFKVRRGKVGGYRDYFDDQQLAVIDGYVREHLDPVFGYGEAEAEPNGT